MAGSLGEVRPVAAGSVGETRPEASVEDEARPEAAAGDEARPEAAAGDEARAGAGDVARPGAGGKGRLEAAGAVWEVGPGAGPRAAVMVISAGRSAGVYLMALPIRLSRTWRTRVGSPRTVGSGERSITGG